MATIVRNKEELKKAIDRKDKEIIAEGDLAKDILKSRKIGTVSKVALASLAAAGAAAVAAAPFTAGTSIGAFAFTAAATTGLSTGAIIAAMTIGGLLIAWAIYNEYDIEIIADDPPKITMKKKKNFI